MFLPMGSVVPHNFTAVLLHITSGITSNVTIALGKNQPQMFSAARSDTIASLRVTFSLPNRTHCSSIFCLVVRHLSAKQYSY